MLRYNLTDLELSDYQALAQFRYQIRKFLHFSEEKARASGLEPQQHQLLLAVKGLPEGKRPTIREVAARLHLKHHSTVELADRLEARGLISRARSADDGREVILELTPSGETVLRRLSLAHRSELETAGPELARALRAVTRSIRRRKADAAA